MTAPPLTPEAASAATAADIAKIVGALSAASGNVGAAARALQVSRATLDRRITAFGLREWLTDTYPRSVRQPKERKRPQRRR